MKIATICAPPSDLFLPAVEKLLRTGGHEVTRVGRGDLVPPPDADAVWCEWADDKAALLSSVRAPNLVVRLHRYEVEDEARFRAIRWENVRALVVTSSHVAWRAQMVVPDIHERTELVVIPSIVDFDRFPLRTMDPDAELRLTVVGYLSGRKQPGLAIAVREEMRARGWEASLWFVGRETEPGWERYVRDRRALLLPWTGDVPSIWETHNCCLVAAQDEGCPYNAIEAMASGRPALVNRYEGAEAQFPVWTLWRYPAEVSECWRDALTRRPENIRAWAAARYSIEANRDAVLDLFR